MAWRSVHFTALCACAIFGYSARAESQALYLERVLEAVEMRDTAENTIELRLTCQSPPENFSLELDHGVEPALHIQFAGYKSRVPDAEEDGLLSRGVRILEEDQGIVVTMSMQDLALEKILQAERALIVSVRPRAETVASAAAGAHPSLGRNDTGQGYRVGPGDLLSISVFGHDDLGGEMRVVSNGTINFPLVGYVYVDGKTTGEISQDLKELLGKDFVVSPQIVVGVSEYLSQPVHLLGEVKRPGKYFLKGPTHLIDILSEAGGLTDNASSEIVITRKESGPGGASSRQIRVSTDALFGSNEAADNVPLLAGDVLNVKEAPVFYIRGEVQRPGQYPLRTETTIQKAISLAGGFTQWADEKDLQIIRDAGGVKQKYVVNLKKISKGKAADMKLEPEDVVVVTRRLL